MVVTWFNGQGLGFTIACIKRPMSQMSNKDNCLQTDNRLKKKDNRLQKKDNRLKKDNRPPPPSARARTSYVRRVASPQSASRERERPVSYMDGKCCTLLF